MKSKKLSEQIIKTFKNKGFVLSEPDILLDSEYIIQRSGEKFRSSMLTFENEDGKIMCLRPDLTVASCINFLQNKSNLVEALEEYINNLNDLKVKIQNNDKESIINDLNNINRVKKILGGIKNNNEK